MNKPKIAALRPSTSLEVLDRAFRVYRDNFGLIIGLTLIAMVPLTALNIFNSIYALRTIQNITTASARNFNYMNSLLSSYGSTTVIAFINGLAQGLLVSAPLTYIASERYLGRSVTIGQAYRAVAGRLLFLGIALVIFYVIFGVLLLATGVSLIFLIGLGLVGIDIYFGINFYAFLVPVVVLERQGLTKSIRRAWSLAKSRFWPLFWLTLAVFTTTGIISVAFTATQTLIGVSTIGSTSYITSRVIAIILTAIITTFVVPILPLTYTLMYYDTRIRREGLDIALASVQTDEPRPADVASPPPGPFMAQQDWQSILLVSLVGLAPLALVICMFVLLLGAFSSFR